MSDPNPWKRSREEEAFLLFLVAYERVTGEQLEILSRPDPPDFYCKRTTGDCVGVELTRIEHDDVLRASLTIGLSMSDGLILRIVAERIESKSSAVAGLLLLQSFTFAVSDYIPVLNVRFPLPRLEETGFAEIWIADYTVVEAYDEVALFCLYPDRFRGFYDVSNLGQKPYG